MRMIVIVMEQDPISKKGELINNEQELLTGLAGVLIADTSKNPEKLNVSFERVEEVLEEVLDHKNYKRAVKILEKQCWDNGNVVQDKRDEIHTGQCEVILGMVKTGLSGGWMTSSQVGTLTNMLDHSEISTKEAIDIHEAYKIPVSKLEKDIVPVKGQGAWMMDTKGKWYLDMDSNYSAANLGFSNPEIALGLFNQASQLITMKEDRVQIPRVRLIKTLLDILPQGLDQFYWQNSGGEAVDKSIKIAKAYTKQKGVIAFNNCFHGRTHGAVSVTSNPEYREPFGLDEENWVTFLDFGDPVALEEQLKKGTEKIVIMELVQGEEGGINVPSKDYIQQVSTLTKKYGAVLIVDEVQTGFARTATQPGQWWASDHFGISPDIMVIGKSFGGGFPVTAVVTTKEIGSKMKPGFDGSTFGGNPMACVAATIAIKQMKQKNLPVHVAKSGQQLTHGLNAIGSPLIKDVHGLGLMIGVELLSTDHVKALQEELKKVGVKSSLSTGAIIRLLPPLIITKEEVDGLIEKFEEAINNVEAKA
jgi:acetylornithine/succinyldiaminopimelate/putrescine aminotransferase